MPILLPILLCLAGILIAALPPHDGTPEPASRGNWIAMAIAATVVVALVVLVVVKLDQSNAAQTASGTPSAPRPSAHLAL